MRLANATLKASLQQAQADVEEMLAVEASSRARSDALEGMLEKEREKTALLETAVRGKQLELDAANAKLSMSASAIEEAKEEVELLRKESGMCSHVCVCVCAEGASTLMLVLLTVTFAALLRARVQAFTAENHALRHASRKPVVSPTACLQLRSEAQRLRQDVSGVRDYLQGFAASMQEFATTEMKRARNAVELAAMNAGAWRTVGRCKLACCGCVHVLCLRGSFHCSSQQRVASLPSRVA